MKKYCIFLFFSFMLLSGNPGTIHAQVHPEEKNHSFGLGVILGSPVGICAKYETSSRTAVEASIGYNYRIQNHLLLSADFLVHPWSRDVEMDELRIFAGLGAGLGFMSDLGISVRIPFGALHHFNAFPLEIFAELVPNIHIIGPETSPFWLSAYIGVRWNF